MAKKLTKGQKAWVTRRANIKAMEAEPKIGSPLRIKLPSDFIIRDGPSMASPIETLTLCQQLEETISRLENRVSNSIARLNALIGKL